MYLQLGYRIIESLKTDLNLLKKESVFWGSKTPFPPPPNPASKRSSKLLCLC